MMRTLDDMIEQHVHLNGNMELSDLSYKDQLTLVIYALHSPEFDNIDTYIDGIDIPGMVLNLFNGVLTDDFKSELKERLIEYFEPIINKKIEDEYVKQYMLEDKREFYFGR